MPSQSKYSLNIMGLVIISLPSVTFSSTIDPVLIPRFGVLAVALLLIIFIRLWRGKQSGIHYNFIISKQALPFYLFVVTAVLAFPNMINPFEGIFVFAKDVLMLLCMLLLINSIDGKIEHIRFFVKCLLISALSISVFALIQFSQVYLSGKNFPNYYEITSTMGHRNLLVSILILHFPFGVFGLYSFQKTWRYLSVLSLLLSLLLIIFLQSRAGWVAFAAMLLFFSLLTFLSYRVEFKTIRKSIIGIGYGLVLLLTVGFSLFYFSSPKARSNKELRQGMGFSDHSQNTFTIDERVFMWQATGRMIKDNSLLGVGPGNWKIWFPEYGSDLWRSRQGLVQFQRPHNDFLWILAEQGILGLTAFLLMILTALYCGIKLVLSSSTPPQIKLLACLLAANLFAYCFIAFFSFPRERILHQLILYIDLSMIFSLYFKAHAKRTNNIKINHRLTSIIGITICTVCLWIAASRIKGEVQTKKILMARSTANWSLLLSEYEAIENSLFYRMDPTSVPISFYSGLAHLNLNNYAKAKSDFVKAYKLHPYNIHVLNNVANVYQLSDEQDNAIKFYHKAIGVSPRYLDGVLNLVAAYFNADEVDKAYLLLKDYARVFSEEGTNTTSYDQYLSVVLNTIHSNLVDSTKEQALKESLSTLTEEQLMYIHQANLSDNEPIQQKILDYIKRKY